MLLLLGFTVILQIYQTIIDYRVHLVLCFILTIFSYHLYICLVYHCIMYLAFHTTNRHCVTGILLLLYNLINVFHSFLRSLFLYLLRQSFNYFYRLFYYVSLSLLMHMLTTLLGLILIVVQISSYLQFPYTIHRYLYIFILYACYLLQSYPQSLLTIH